MRGNLAVVAVAVAVLVAVRASSVAGQAVVVEDSWGNLVINTSDARVNDVVVNGVSINTLASTAKEQAATLQAHERLIAQQQGVIDALQGPVCALRSRFAPHVDHTTIANLPDGDSVYKFEGAVLVRDRYIYAAPTHATYVLIIDTHTNTADTTSIANLPATSFKWAGAVLAPESGLVYMFPVVASSLLVVDPATNAHDQGVGDFSSLGSTLLKWSGACMAGNGLMYAIPYSYPSVLIVDPATNSTDTTTLAGVGAGTLAVRGPEGALFGIPDNANVVLIIDPYTNTADTTSLPVFPGVDKYNHGVLAPNGLIYAVPDSGQHVLVIDPATRTAEEVKLSNATGVDKWSAPAVAPDGRVVAAPQREPTFLVIDPGLVSVGRAANQTVDRTLRVAHEGNAATNRYSSVVRGANGYLYAIPRGADDVLIVDMGC